MAEAQQVYDRLNSQRDVYENIRKNMPTKAFPGVESEQFLAMAHQLLLLEGKIPTAEILERIKQNDKTAPYLIRAAIYGCLCLANTLSL